MILEIKNKSPFLANLLSKNDIIIEVQKFVDTSNLDQIVNRIIKRGENLLFNSYK